MPKVKASQLRTNACDTDSETLAKMESLVNQILTQVVRNNGPSLECLKINILTDYLLNPANLIRCPKAGRDIWLKNFFESSESKVKMVCENGNHFYYCPEAGLITKYVIRKKNRVNK